MRKKMIIKIISWIIFIGLVIALIVGAINIYMVTTTSKRIISVDDAKDINADCIIVLGAGVKPTGTIYLDVLQGTNAREILSATT